MLKFHGLSDRASSPRQYQKESQQSLHVFPPHLISPIWTIATLRGDLAAAVKTETSAVRPLLQFYRRPFALSGGWHSHCKNSQKQQYIPQETSPGQIGQIPPIVVTKQSYYMRIFPRHQTMKMLTRSETLDILTRNTYRRGVKCWS